MKIVIITALGVGGATLFGSILGFVFKKISQRSNDIVLSFAAGVMLAASVFGLFLPAIEIGGRRALPAVLLGILGGALAVDLLDRLVPAIYKDAGGDTKRHRVLLFVLAIAIHNLPEGLAAGVGFGTGDISDGIIIAAGIALQNIPEGMVIIAPMLSAGIGPRRTFLIAAATGAVEVVGTVTGFFTVSICAPILPFALSFAGGTMLYVINEEMLAEIHGGDCGRSATYALIAGFCVILAMDVILG